MHTTKWNHLLPYQSPCWLACIKPYEKLCILMLLFVLFALKLTELFIIEGSSMTYGSKHTDSAVELKKQPPQPTRCDRYLQIPDLLSSQIMIPNRLGWSGSFEPIRSVNTQPQPINHNQTDHSVDSNTPAKKLTIQQFYTVHNWGDRFRQFATRGRGLCKVFCREYTHSQGRSDCAPEYQSNTAQQETN